MTIPEWLKTGKRKCECHDVKLICAKYQYNRMIRRGGFANQVAAAFHGNKYTRETVWRLFCDQCLKLYMVAGLKRKAESAAAAAGMELRFAGKEETKKINGKINPPKKKREETREECMEQFREILQKTFSDGMKIFD